MILAHRIALDPTDKQRRYFSKAAGCARFVWNLALAEWNRRYETGEQPNIYEISRDFNALKYKAFPWMKKINKDCHSRPLLNLDKAFLKFFNKKSKHPKFHKKGSKDNFYIENRLVKIIDSKIRLPRIGWIRMCESLRYSGKIINTIVSRNANRWFISIHVDVGDFKQNAVSRDTVGCDAGITNALTLSSGEKIDAPRPLKKEQEQNQCPDRKHPQRFLAQSHDSALSRKPSDSGRGLECGRYGKESHIVQYTTRRRYWHDAADDRV